MYKGDILYSNFRIQDKFRNHVETDQKETRKVWSGIGIDQEFRSERCRRDSAMAFYSDTSSPSTPRCCWILSLYWPRLRLAPIYELETRTQLKGMKWMLTIPFAVSVILVVWTHLSLSAGCRRRRTDIHGSSIVWSSTCVRRSSDTFAHIHDLALLVGILPRPSSSSSRSAVASRSGLWKTERWDRDPNWFRIRTSLYTAGGGR